MTSNWQEAEDRLAKLYPGRFDQVMLSCIALAKRLYEERGLRHERIARDLAEFLRARLTEQSASPQLDAVLSVVNANVDTATYMSCGSKAIQMALACLIRLALPHADHPDYREQWKP